MAGTTISLRLPEELLAWADAYSKTCGCTRTDLIAKGLCLIRESGPDSEPITVEPANPSPSRVEAARRREEETQARVQRAVAATAGAVAPASEFRRQPGRQDGVNKMIDRARGTGRVAK